MGDGFVGAYAVYFSCEEELLVIAGVAGEENDGEPDDDGYVMWLCGRGSERLVRRRVW